jgi:SpoIIAA-like
VAGEDVVIEVIADAPGGVLAFRAVGQIGPDDYRQVVRPAIDLQLAAGRKLRIVLVLDDSVTGPPDRTAFEDLGLGLSSLRRLKRIALVTDQDWVKGLTARFGWLLARRLRLFGANELGVAMAWAAA